MATITNTIRWADNTEQLRRNLEEGLDQIEAMTKSADKLAKAYGGDSLIRAAHSHAAAIEKIGGVSKLTAAEKERLNGVVSRAIEKYQALGKTAPTAMLELERATRKVEEPTGGLFNKLGGLQKAFAALGVAKVAKDTLDAAGRLTDLSSATGLSVRELGRLQAVGAPVGVSIDDITKGAARLQNELVGGNKGVSAALRRVGLDVDDLRNMSPGQLFETVASAVSKVEDPMLRTHLGMELFGKGGIALMPLLRTEISKVADEAERTGRVMDEDMVAQLDNAGDQVDKFKDQVLVLVGKPLSLLVSLIDVGSTKWTNFAAGADLAWAAIKRLSTVAMPKLPDTPASILPAKLQIDLPPVAELTAEMTRQKEAADKAAKALEAHRQKIRGLHEDLSGTKLAGEVRDVNTAIAQIQKSGPLSTAQLERIGDRAAQLSAQGAVLTGELRAVWLAQERWKDGMPRVEIGLGSILKRAQDVTKALGNGGVLGGIESFLNVGKGPIVFGQKVELAPPKNALQSFSSFLQKNIPDVMMNAFQGGGGAMKSLGGALGGFVTSGTSTIGKALAGGLTGMLGKGVGGALGSVLPGIGTALGSMVGSFLGGKLGGLFGKSKNALMDQEATTQIRKMQAELLKTHGSLEDIRRMGQMVGVDLAGAWGDRSQAGLRNFTALAEEFAEKQARLQAALEKYGLTWVDMGAQARAAHLDQVADDLLADFAVLQTSGVGLTRIVQGMSGAINQFLNDALTTGGAIPPAMQPMIEQLIRTGQLTEENAALMLGMKRDAVPAWADIEAAAGRYGIELDRLGPKIDQIRINEEAAQMVADFNLLVGAGADVGVVLEGMKDKAQGFVLSALRFGTEIPDSMRPMLEQMVAAGMLVDENGVKLGDLSRINFAKPLADMVDALIGKLNELIDSIRGGSGVAGAIREIDGRQFSITGKVNWDAVRTGTGGTAAAEAHVGAFVGLTGIQRHHKGAARILRFHSGVANLAGDEVPAILQVGESVLNRRATQMIGPDAIRAINSGKAGGGGGVTRVDVRTDALEQRMGSLEQTIRDQADRTYRAIRDAVAQGAA